jgi:hypothetical protein
MCDEQGELNSKSLCLCNSSTPEAEAAGDVASEQLCELEATVTSVKAKKKKKKKVISLQYTVEQDIHYCSKM